MVFRPRFPRKAGSEQALFRPRKFRSRPGGLDLERPAGKALAAEALPKLLYQAGNPAVGMFPARTVPAPSRLKAVPELSKRRKRRFPLYRQTGEAKPGKG